MKPATDWDRAVFHGQCTFVRAVGGRFGGGVLLKHPTGFILLSRAQCGVRISAPLPDGYGWLLYLELGGRIVRATDSMVSFQLQGARETVFATLFSSLCAVLPQ